MAENAGVPEKKSIGFIFRRAPEPRTAALVWKRNLPFSVVCLPPRPPGKKLKAGRPKHPEGPRHARQRFAEKYGTGSARKFFALRSAGASYRRIGRESGFSHTNASDWDRKMNPGNPKPPAATSVLGRPDVTPEKITELIQSGRYQTAKALAGALACDESTLANRAIRHNIVLPKGKSGGNARTDLTHARLHKCPEKSTTIAEMARKLKAAPLTVIKWCRQWEVEMPEDRRRRGREKKLEEVRRLANLGWSQNRISRELKMSKATVAGSVKTMPHPEPDEFQEPVSP